MTLILNFLVFYSLFPLLLLSYSQEGVWKRCNERVPSFPCWLLFSKIKFPDIFRFLYFFTTSMSKNVLTEFDRKIIIIIFKSWNFEKFDFFNFFWNFLDFYKYHTIPWLLPVFQFFPKMPYYLLVSSIRKDENDISWLTLLFFFFLLWW